MNSLKTTKATSYLFATQCVTAMLVWAMPAFAGNNFDFKAAEQKPSADFNKLEVSAVEGKAPLTVRITGPANVAALKTNMHEKYVNCGFTVQWGDGASFPVAVKRGQPCAPGFEHVFAKPGAYKVVFLITNTGPTDENVVVWKGEQIIKVQ